MLTYKLTVHEHYCLARLGGLVSFDGWEAVLGGVAAELAATKAPPCLVVEMTAVVGYLGVPERRAVGALMAQYFKNLSKVAIVVQAHKITDVVRSEARQRGLNLQLFPECAHAVAWVVS